MILLIKHVADWELICHQKQVKINEYNIRKKSKIVDHNYKVGDKVMLNNNTAFKYQTHINIHFRSYSVGPTTWSHYSVMQ